MTYSQHLEISLLSEDSEGDLVTIRVVGEGLDVMIMGTVVAMDAVLVVDDVHVNGNESQSASDQANSLGMVTLREIIRRIMKIGGFDAVHIQGSNRTTGANPKRRPGLLRFTRNRGDKH